jgi:uncharacterized membrane protein YeaQ/YmgE (transglycosylase-associated protein family)
MRRSNAVALPLHRRSCETSARVPDVVRPAWSTITEREVDLVLAAAQRMDILMWLVVGLVAGALASVLVRGGGFGLVGEILLGMAGAVVGGWTVHQLGWQSPFSGVAGSIAVAFAGAVIILVALRLLRGAMVRP